MTQLKLRVSERSGIYVVGKAKKKRKIGNAESAINLAYELVGNLPHEEVHIICLNGGLELIGTFCISQGGVSQASVTMGDVLRPVLICGAVSFMLVHNHPSGSCEPSSDDISFTRQIRNASKTIGLHLLDHIIVGNKEFCVFSQKFDEFF